MIYQDNQDQTSGAEAAEWGRETAPKIAIALGFEKVSDIGNEFRDRDGKLLSIRCARRKNSKFGLVHTMRERLDYVISAYVNEGGKVDLYKISVDMWIKHSRTGSSGTPGNVTQTQMTLRDLEKFGRQMPGIYI
jgi:hypothetical protein